jgi:tetratricopeptide (TPR) repeat protein
MQSHEHVKRLIRELELPDQADLIIQRAKYWSPDFCWLYFERCDELIFDDSHAGLQAAEVGPELVALVSRFCRDPEPSRPLRLRALGVLGSAYRAVGDLTQAEEIYRDGLHILRAGQVPVFERANYLFRLAVLRTAQNRLDDALELASGSVRIYRESSEAIRKRHLGEALIIRGHVHDQAGDTAAAMKDWSEALSCTDPKTRPRVHHCASYNLAYGLVAKGAIDSRSLSRVEGHLSKARKFLSKRPRSKQKLLLIWLQGIVMIRFGSTRRGEAALKSARRGFLEMEAAFELALVSLDLGKHLYRSRELDELKELAIETQQLFSALCADAQANQALVVWRDAVLARSVSIEAFASTWQTVQRQAIGAPRPD